MLTETFDCESSGKSKQRRPLSKRYSVMRWTVAIFCGVGGSAVNTLPTTAKRMAAAARSRLVWRPSERERQEEDAIAFMPEDSRQRTAGSSRFGRLQATRGMVPPANRGFT